MQIVLKLLSRKFLVTLGALWALISTADGPRLWVIAAVATLYVVAEAVLDVKGKPQLVAELGTLIEEGIQTARAASDTATPPTLVSPTLAVEPADPTPTSPRTEPFPDVLPAPLKPKATLLPPLPGDLTP